MSVQTEEIDLSWANHRRDPAASRTPRRRVRGLRFPVLPTGSLVAQALGAIATEVGLYLAAGVAATLIAGGVAAIIVGALKEAGKV